MTRQFWTVLIALFVLTLQQLVWQRPQASRERTPAAAVVKPGLQRPQQYPVNLHVSVKTTSAEAYVDKVASIVQTWYTTAKKETWFVTDSNSSRLWELGNGQVIATGCPSAHGLTALCCKTEAEVKLFYDRRQSNPTLNWFCHIDDDMYLLRDNLIALLEQYDGSNGLHFIGPNNFWPDDTRHLNSLTTKSGILHPMSVYCISGPLIDALYPLHMKGGRFRRSCTNRPDDVILSDLIFSVGISLTVNNNFHQQHSKHDKLPMYDLKEFATTAITTFGYGNLRLVHQLLTNATHTNSPWWARIANLSILSPKKPRRASFGFSYCRRMFPRPNKGVHAGWKEDASQAQWCGPPIRVFSEKEPLCHSRRSYLELHPTHSFTESDVLACPYFLSSVRQSAGTPATIDRGFLASLYGKRFTRTAAQHGRQALQPVFHDLAMKLANAGTPGTCCIANPHVSDSEGGRCYWTAEDQTLCSRL